MNCTSAFIQRYSLELKNSKRKILARRSEQKNIHTCIWKLFCCKMIFFLRSISLLFSLPRKYLMLHCYGSTWPFPNWGIRVWYITCCCSNPRTHVEVCAFHTDLPSPKSAFSPSVLSWWPENVGKKYPKQFLTDPAEKKTLWHFSSSSDIEVIVEIQSQALQLELGLSKLLAWFFVMTRVKGDRKTENWQRTSKYNWQAYGTRHNN